MLTLEQQQRALLAMVRQRPAAEQEEPVDPWLQSVKDSPGLKMIHRIGSWWQCFQLESYCRYTTRLLKRRGCFERYVEEHFRMHPTPPSIEELALQFLQSAGQGSDCLLSAVAQFELACLEMNIAPATARTIVWDRNPEAVLTALTNFSSIPEPDVKTRFLLTLNASLPGGVSCVREEVPA